jgi:hypothetical protein
MFQMASAKTISQLGESLAWDAGGWSACGVIN